MPYRFRLERCAGLLLCVVLTMFVAGCSAEKQSGEKKGKAVRKIGKLLTMDSVVVNIPGTDSRYLKATVSVEVPDDEKQIKEVEERKSQILDVLVSDLRKRPFSELTSPDALTKVRSELLEGLQRAVGHELVRQVLVTEFVVQ